MQIYQLLPSISGGHHLYSPLKNVFFLWSVALCKVLACSTTFFQLSPFRSTFFQLRIFMLFISSKTPSSQRVLGLPIGLLDMGFHLLIFCTLLSSAMHSIWPNQFSFCFLMNPLTFWPFNVIDFLISFNPHWRIQNAKGKPANIIWPCWTTKQGTYTK